MKTIFIDFYDRTTRQSPWAFLNLLKKSTPENFRAEAAFTSTKIL
jgi:hypothetical protein